MLTMAWPPRRQTAAAAAAAALETNKKDEVVDLGSVKVHRAMSVRIAAAAVMDKTLSLGKVDGFVWRIGLLAMADSEEGFLILMVLFLKNCEVEISVSGKKLQTK